METDRIIIFDTTLRDGEQSPGATMHTHEKLQIAKQLARLGVDVIEAGFPAPPPAIGCRAQVARSVQGPVSAGWRACAAIRPRWEAIQDPARNAFTSSSPPATFTCSNNLA